MRAVLVLLVLGLAAWGIYRLLPASAVEGKEASAREIPFLERPAGPPPGTAPAPTPAPAAAEGAAEGATEDVGAFGLSASEAPSGVAQDPLLARALLFGGPADVERALTRLAPEEAERRLYVSFAQALAGDRKAGIRTAAGLDAPDVLATADRALLQAALSGAEGAAPREAAAGAPVTRRAMRLRLVERDARAELEAGRHAAAAAGFSELLVAALEGPWEPERAALVTWTAGLDEAQARHRWDPRGDWPSVEVTVEPGDTLTHVRKRFLAEHPDGLVCTGLIARANQLTGYIHPGDVLRVPTDRPSVLVDLSARWLLFRLGGEVVASWEVGIGREGQETIQGRFLVGDKQREPTWFPRGQPPQYYPDNPLGTRWVAWYRDGEKTGYGFHGTWEPESIGKAASDGCIRLRNDEVETLYEIVPVGTPIRVQE